MVIVWMVAKFQDYRNPILFDLTRLVVEFGVEHLWIPQIQNNKKNAVDQNNEK